MPSPHYPSPSTTTFSAYERSVGFASCKTLGVQHRASLPVPCQRELACGKPCFYQIRPFFATPTTSKSCKPYLPSRLRDRLHRTFPLLPSPPLTVPQKLAEFNSATEAHLYTRGLNCDTSFSQFALNPKPL